MSTISCVNNIMCQHYHVPTLSTIPLVNNIIGQQYHVSISFVNNIIDQQYHWSTIPTILFVNDIMCQHYQHYHWSTISCVNTIMAGVGLRRPLGHERRASGTGATQSVRDVIFGAIGLQPLQPVSQCFVFRQRLIFWDHGLFFSTKINFFVHRLFV